MGVLVNNVGMSYEYPEYFLQVSTNDLIHQLHIGSQLKVENGEARFQALVDCNINSMLSVTRAVLPSMVSRCKKSCKNKNQLKKILPMKMMSRGKGAVINMSSFSAHCGPLLSVYSGSKAFVIQFSSDLEVHSF